MRNRFFVVAVVLVCLFLASYFLSNILAKEDAYFGERIVIIPIKGVITIDGSGLTVLQKGISSEVIVDYITQANKDDSVKGIILDINSPGGTVVASKQIADAVESSEKPVVALLNEVATSGAYWVASASDKIVADPMTITGSIGVTGSYFQFSELMKKYGIGYEGIYAGKYKELGSPFREPSDDEIELLGERVKKVYLFFIGNIANNRNLTKSQITEVSSGAIYLGIEAYDMGLVDSLGNKDTAINITKEMCNITDARLVKYEFRRRFVDLIKEISAESFYYMGKGISDGFEVENRVGFNV